MYHEILTSIISWLGPIQDHDKQDKVLSNSFSILPRYSFMKFENSNSISNFKFCENPLFTLTVKSFFPWSMCSPMKGFHLIVPLRYNQRPAKFSILTLQCAGWLLGCEAHRGVWLSGEMHTAESDSAARCTPRSLTQRQDAHRGVWLSGETHTTESDSAARCTVHTAESDSAVRCTPRSLSFLKNRRPRWNRNWIKTILSCLTGIHMGSNY